MDKRGVIWEELADVFIGGSILFLAVLAYIMITDVHQESVTALMQEKVTELGQKELLASYFMATTKEGNSVSDIITLAYVNKDEKHLAGLDSFLEEVYGGKVCWTLYKDNSLWVKENVCKVDENILDETLILPLPDKKILQARLYISGYVK